MVSVSYTHLDVYKRQQVVVSTDAIGMGLNLPVRRIVFLEVEKFDGVSRRPLVISEIKQIAGRAGRFGLYDTGYVLSLIHISKRTSFYQVC